MRQILLLKFFVFFIFNCLGQSASKTYVIPEIGITLSVPNNLKLTNVTRHPDFLDSNWNIITDTGQIRVLKSTSTTTLLDLETRNSKMSIQIVKTPINNYLVKIMGDSSNRFKEFKEIALRSSNISNKKSDTLTARIDIGKLHFEKFLITTQVGNKRLTVGTYLSQEKSFLISIGFKCDTKLLAERMQLVIDSAKSQ